MPTRCLASFLHIAPVSNANAKYLDGFTQLWVATVTASVAAFPFGCGCIDSK